MDCNGEGGGGGRNTNSCQQLLHARKPRISSGRVGSLWLVCDFTLCNIASHRFTPKFLTLMLVLLLIDLLRGNQG